MQKCLDKNIIRCILELFFLLFISQYASAREGKLVGIADCHSVTVLSKNNDQIRIRLYSTELTHQKLSLGRVDHGSNDDVEPQPKDFESWKIRLHLG